MLIIDGSQGEGGGQILRTSLALSLVTGQPFRIEKVRAGRRKPGLRRQHLTAVQAASLVGQARVEGDTLGSQTLTFSPRGVESGEYHFAISTAGSTTLVLQTVLPALCVAPGPSSLVLEGGTHNPMAPPFDFIQRAFLPLVARTGPRVEARLERYGFYPAGGGRFSATIQPVERGALKGFELLRRGPVLARRARAVVARLPGHIAERELAQVRSALGWPRAALEAEEIQAGPGQGNVLILEVESEEVTEVFTGFGRRGLPAERVADGAAAEARRYLECADVPVGEQLADQLLLPLALAGSGAYRALSLSSHTQTNIEVVQRFLPLEISTTQLGPDDWRVDLASR